MRRLLVIILLFAGFAAAQLDLSTPGGASVLATFVTDPAGAEVYVAGTFIGTSPATVRINLGTPTPYTVRIPGGDYEVYSGTVNLGEAGVTEVYVPRVATSPQPSLPSSSIPTSPSTPFTASSADSVDLLLRLAACADLNDSLARLTCYDRLVLEYGLSGGTSPTDPSPTALNLETAPPDVEETSPVQPSAVASTQVPVLSAPDPRPGVEVGTELALDPVLPSRTNKSIFDTVRDGSYEEVYAEVGAGVDVNAADAYGQTVLMYAATGNQDPDVLATLVARGAEVDARTLARWTALMYAARDNPNPEVLLRLLALGADPQLVNSQGLTALDLARDNPALRNTYVLDRLEALTAVAPPAPVPVPRAVPAPTSPQPAPVSQGCCKYCRKGYACGNTCIASNKTCHAGVGCACNAGVGTDDSLIAADEQFFTLALETDFEEPVVAGVCGEILELSFAFAVQ